MTVKENIARLHEAKGRQRALQASKSETETAIHDLHDLQLAIEEASTLLQDTAKESQEKVKLQLAALVTRALHTIYPEELYHFTLKFVSERGQTSVYPTLILADNELDPLDNSGGMAEVVSFALRIALIAIGKKPKIMILDDSTSAVDTATDIKIRTALKQKLKDMTTIIIAQRVASVMDADKIIVLDDGGINAVGNHKELMENCEIYREVYSSQVNKVVGI